MAAIRASGTWLSGALFISALPILYFSYHGIFRQFYYWSFQHNAAYAARLSWHSWFYLIRPRFTEILRGDFLILGFAIFGAVYRIVKKEPGGYFIPGFLLLSLAGAMPGYGYRHYFAQLAPAVALAGGRGISSLVEIFRDIRMRWAAAAVCILLILVVPIAMNAQYFLERDPDKISGTYFGESPFAESKALADYVVRATSASDPVFILGSEPQILFYAERKSPASLLMAYPMTASFPRYREFQDQLWGELQNTPPKYVLSVVNIPASFSWDQKANLDVLDRINEWLRSNYEVTAVMVVSGSRGGWLATLDDPLLQSVPCIYVLRKKG